MDLRSRYMELDLQNPLVASASPLTGTLDNLRLLEDAGVGAIVLPSLFQEHIEAEARRYEADVYKRQSTRSARGARCASSSARATRSR